MSIAGRSKFDTLGCRRCFGCILILAAGSVQAFADVPRLIDYQGKLRDSAGVPVDGPVALRFRLYGHATNSTLLLFDETHPSVSVSNGLFTALIGSQSGGVPDSALDAAEIYLDVAINGTELSPRTPIVTTPHAIKAKSAEQLVRPGTYAAAVTVDDATGNVGVGTTSPLELLSLGAEGTTRGVLSVAGDASGKIIIQPAANAGTYTLTLPTAQGAASTFLQNDGAGSLSWAPAGGLVVQSDTSTATPTPDSETDFYTITALATIATFAAPTGTPAEGHKLIIRITDDGTARTLAWNGIYRELSTTFPLPAATVSSKPLYLTFIYNDNDSKWDLILSVLPDPGPIAYNSDQGRNIDVGTSVSLAGVAPTGNSRCLICTLLAETAGTVASTPPTFGGSAMTQLGPYVNTGDGAKSFSVWYLLNPSTTPGSVTATINNSTVWLFGCESYTGVDQTTPFGPVTTGTDTTGTVMIQRTSDVNGSWMFLSAKADSGASPLTLAAGGVGRQVVSPPGTVTAQMYDSNAMIASGVTHSMTVQHTGGGQRMGYIAAMLRPG